MFLLNTKFKLVFLLAGLLVSMFYLFNLGAADPTGASLTYITRYNGTSADPEAQTHPGGTIVTITLDAVQQDTGWKAYIGNITGKLVLRNSDSQSIYEWYLDESTLGGNLFVTRNDSITWANIKCANSTIVQTEEAFLGMNSSASDSITSTFNSSLHSSMTISGIGTISTDTCNSTATYVNGTAQTVNSDAYFQEILLSDDLNLVYATFIDRNAFGYDTNATQNITHDFQLIVAENKTSQTGNTYYFYADISG